MKIDDSIVKKYLAGQRDFREHWLYYSFSQNEEYIFEPPTDCSANKITDVLNSLLNNLEAFLPYNAELISTLFPNWKSLLSDANILLVAGCPAPYDAFVTENNKREYLVFDIFRLLEYQQKGIDLLSVVTRMITHEVVHIFIHNDYPDTAKRYREKLAYIVFNEGFAHLLSFVDHVEAYDFSGLIADYYERSLRKLKQALLESDTILREQYLKEADSGPYWEKYAAISGKLYLASNIDKLHKIYAAGPNAMLEKMY